MVALIRRGLSKRAVARRLRQSLPTLPRWGKRAVGRRPRAGRLAWPLVTSSSDTAHRHLPGGRGVACASRVERAQRSGRVWCCGDPPRVAPAWTCHAALCTHDWAHFGAPCGPRCPPPAATAPATAGWHLPAVAAREAELDSFDGVEGLVIEGGPPVEVLTGISRHGGLVAAWPMTAVTAQTTLDALIEHWRVWGLQGFPVRS